MNDVGESPKGDSAQTTGRPHEKGPWGTRLARLLRKTWEWILGVPVRVKIGGMVLLPVLILGFAINYWVRNSLSDWLSRILDSQRVQVAMQAGGRSVLLVTLLAAALSLLLTSVLMLGLTKPILELKEMADKVRGGALDRRAPVRSKDEIGQVAESFNRMVDKLVRSRRDLERSHERLESLYHVTSSVGKGLDLGIVLRAALSSTMDAVELSSGWIYLRDPDSGRFYLASEIEAPHEVLREPLSVPGEFCGCQRALLREEWGTPEVRRCRRIGRGRHDLNDLPQHLSIPLRAQGLTLGVFNLLWTKDQPVSPDDMDLLAALGAQVSEAVANARLHADVREKEAGMQALVHSLVTAQEDERSLISSELHDGTGQELTSVLLQLKALESKHKVGELKAGLSNVCEDLSQAIERLRSLSHQLRPPDLEQLGLGPTLRNLMTDMLGDAGIVFRFRSRVDGLRLDPTIEITLYRIAQEALTNITRHAQPTSVHLTLGVTEEELTLVVEDDGRGFDPDELMASERGHIGLASIQERAERLGGSLVVASAPGEGTRLTVRIPHGEDSR